MEAENSLLQDSLEAKAKPFSASTFIAHNRHLEQDVSEWKEQVAWLPLLRQAGDICWESGVRLLGFWRLVASAAPGDLGQRLLLSCCAIFCC